MARGEDVQINKARRAYRSAKEEGNRQEEARWANVIGDILKNRGEYVEALKWFRIDYDISNKYLPEKQLLPTCQSLGEVYLRLVHYKDALIYQKKHLELAKDANDLVEQQRASTQLGRTYHEMFLKSDDDHYSIRNAKKYFKSAMKLAQTLKETPPNNKSSFLKEYIDAHNNIGMLEVDLDNLDEALKFLTKGLEICDEEEVIEDDDARSRLHHNLGNAYMELRRWDKAREHIENDIMICKRIEHLQGEAKGYINLGELHYRVQKYDDAMLCYQKAFDLAKSMEDEDALAAQIDQNIQTVKEAINVMNEMKNEEQTLKKLQRNMVIAKETPHERKFLLQQHSSLDRLIEKSAMIFAWLKHREFAKRKKRIASELCDKEKLTDAFLVVGESYQKLRDFSKAIKCATKGCNYCSFAVDALAINFRIAAEAKLTSIQLSALENMHYSHMIRFDNVEEASATKGCNYCSFAVDALAINFRIAAEAKLTSIQLSALENMHYSHMIRFDNVEEARRLQLEIDKLKQSKVEELDAKYIATDSALKQTIGSCCQHCFFVADESFILRRLQLEIDKLKQSKVEELDAKYIATDFCSETDTEGDDHFSDDMPNTYLEALCSSSSKSSTPLAASGESNDDLPLISLIKPRKRSCKSKTAHTVNKNISMELDDTLPEGLPKPTSNQKTVVRHKRVRLFLSDDEGDLLDDARRLHKCSVEVAVSDEFTRKNISASSENKLQDTLPVASRSPSRSCNLVNIEESTRSYKSPRTVSNGKVIRSLSDADVVIGSSYADSTLKCDINASENLLHGHDSPYHKLHATDNEFDGCIAFKIDDNIINVSVSSFVDGENICIESLKVELACLYYLQLPAEKSSKGLLPIIQNMECGGRPLESFENFDSLKNHLRKVPVDVLTSGWVQKHLVKLYINSCKELHETPSMKLLRKLYVSEIEDEVNASDCGLLDISVIPLLNALHTHTGVAMLDLSHNALGNGTMEKLQQFFSSSNQTYGDLTLDLHCNRFGSTALFQICECPVLFTRLEVLNISCNRLTDACGSYLLTIIEKCRALYSLNVERCSITSRTVQKVADALDTDSVLSQLFIGHNNPVSGNAISSLLGKLATLKRFSELSLNGLKLNKTVVDGLCHLAKTSCLSRLMLEGTGIGTDGALGLTHLLLSSIEEPLKLDLSFCGVTCTYISELNTNVMFISGILELNLQGNPIMQEGGNALASLLMNPQCCLKVLNLNKCQLGMAGILQIVQALAENESLEELNLAHNADMDKQLVIKYDKPTNMSSESLQPNQAVSDGEIDTNCDMLEVTDSKDDETKGETAASCQRNSTLECNLIQGLSVAIGTSKRLQLLDLSDNGLSIQDSKALYNAWSSGSRAGSSWRHIEDQIVHFSVEGNNHKHQRYSLAYINFKRPEDVFDFAEFFGEHVFVNQQAFVEYAPSQQVAKPDSKKDACEGTIFKDPDYLEFLKMIAKPVENLPSAEIQLERKEAELSGAPKGTPVITPLMEFVRQSQAAESGAQGSITLRKAGKKAAAASRGKPGSSSKRGSEKKNCNHWVGSFSISKSLKYILKDGAKGAKKSNSLVASKKEDQSVTSFAKEIRENGTVCGIDGPVIGIYFAADSEKQKILLLKPKDRRAPHLPFASEGKPELQGAPSPVATSSGSIALRQPVQPQHKNETMSLDNIKRPSWLTNARLGFGSKKKHEKSTRNKDRPDRGVWAPLLRSEVPQASEEHLTPSVSQSAQPTRNPSQVIQGEMKGGIPNGSRGRNIPSEND
ncbi:Tetratricopeptide repeat-containing protein, putative isoform 3 [Hibiscus syriacus]|uniref:Protein TONSOKU n=1 Tax=Hibiscus syriacus TaxID=106335 RepID=A0A6A2XE95_HIBSY|nr:Tetratricopeptide repeat-containing protein, putative isoform 3 [Hibiscus syriacus]